MRQGLGQTTGGFHRRKCATVIWIWAELSEPELQGDTEVRDFNAILALLDEKIILVSDLDLLDYPDLF